MKIRSKDRHKLNGGKIMPIDIYSGRPLVLNAHQDDEILGDFCLMREILNGGGDLHVAFATNGAPEKDYPRDTGSMVFNTPEEYAFTRRCEAIAALGTLGLNEDRILFLDLYDRTFYRNLEVVEKAIRDVIRETRPTRIFVPTNERGNPEHDCLNAVSFAIRYGSGMDFWEYALYHISNGIRVFNTFPDGLPDYQIVINENERVLKMRALELYKSQFGGIISECPLEKESFREMPNSFSIPSNVTPDYITPNPSEVNDVIIRYLKRKGIGIETER